MATACGASTTTSNLWSCCHLQHQHLLPRNYCRIQHLVLTLMCPSEQVLMYPEQPFYTKRKSKEQKTPCVTLILGADFESTLVFSKCRELCFMNQKLRQERSVWGLKTIGNYFLCFLLLPFFPCLLSVWEQALCLISQHFKAPLEAAFIAAHCYLVVQLQMVGGKEGLADLIPGATAFILLTSLLWQENLWPYEYSFPLNSQRMWKVCV